MNKLGIQNRLGLSLSTQLVLLLAVSILLWSIGAPMLLQRAHAANLTQISDTLSTSNLSTNAKHAIKFTTVSNVGNNQTIKISLDSTTLTPAGTAAFAEAFSAATSSDIYFGTSTPNGYAVVSACTSGNQVQAVGTYNTGTDENLTFTICPSSPTIIASSTQVNIVVGSTTQLWTNPAGTGSYRVNVYTPYDQGETRIAVLPVVTLTANVSTSFTFTVSGLATTTGLFGNLATTTASSTATALPFATLASSTGPVVLAQQLNVTTNARNGFSVTVQENQPPTSSTGATIDLFKNGATTSVPTAWTAPTAILDVPSTYGHFGITSDDVDEGGGEFASGALWAGNINQPRVVFSHTGPSGGVTQNKGKADVGYKIQISDLQEAGTDYTNTLWYVATPTF